MSGYTITPQMIRDKLIFFGELSFDELARIMQVPDENITTLYLHLKGLTESGTVRYDGYLKVYKPTVKFNDAFL